MARSPRHTPRDFSAFIAVIQVAALSTVPGAAGASGPVRVTAVANATVRTAPSADAPAVAQLPLGTEVQEAGPPGLDKTWVLVRLDDARQGWVQTRLTRPLDPVWPTEAFDSIIAERLSRKGDGFNATVELVAFIDRVAPTYGDPESRAGIELARVRALSRAASAIPFGGGRREPYASWIAERQKDVVYDEPGGRWMIRHTTIWNVHALHRDTRVADDMAWFAVTTGLPGECEGFLACYLSAQNSLHGAYLRAHPFGRHAAEAVNAVNSMLNAVMSSSQINPSYSFDRKQDCQELGAAIDGLTSAIQTAKRVGSESALTGLASVRKLCP